MSASRPQGGPADFLQTALKFGLVGLCSIGVYFLLLYALRPLVGPIWLLAGLAYVGSMGFNYIAQSVFTFQTKAQDLGTVKRYVWMHIGCMVFNSASMYGLVELLGLNLWTSQVAVTVCVAGLSFLLSRYWVYRTP